VLQGLEYSLPAKSIQCPKENRIELTTGSGSKHLLKLVSIGTLAACPVFVLAHDCPVLRGAELSQLAQLILGVLFVSTADSCVDGDSHKIIVIRKYVIANGTLVPKTVVLETPTKGSGGLAKLLILPDRS
jgi:hypothetical protein